jgi:ubiquinone/menaquinone biosynthesis C-methylase UbiE
MKEIYENPVIGKYSLGKSIRKGYILELLKIYKVERVIDVGSGSGTFSRILHEKGCKVVAVEIDWESVKLAKEVSQPSKGLFYVTADGTKIPFKNAIFDMAICSEVLEHIKDDKAVISEIKRVLRPGGIAIITVPTYGPGFWSNKLFRLFGMKFLEYYGHIRPGYKERQLKQMLEKADFKVQSVRYLTHFFSIIIHLTIFIIRNLVRKTSTKNLGKEETLDLSKKPIFKIYKILFPILNFIMKVEDLLFKNTKFKGANLLITAQRQK